MLFAPAIGIMPFSVGCSESHSSRTPNQDMGDQSATLSDISLTLLYESSDVGQVKDLDIADVDHDGDPEILAGTDEGYVKVFNLESETLETQFTVNIGGVRSISVDDLDDDGQIEVVAATHTTWSSGEKGRLYIFDGSTGDIEWESADLDGLGTVEIVDVDADGSLEIVAIGKRGKDGTSSTQGHLYVFDVATKNLEWSQDGYGYFLGETGCIGNIDADSALEIIFTGRSSASTPYDTTLYVVDGSSQATDDSLALGAWRGKTTQIADLDSDGTPEVIVGAQKDDKSISELRIYDHLLDLEWTHDVANTELPSQIITGEFDGDSSLEIVFGVAIEGYAGLFYVLDTDSQNVIYTSSSTGLVESFSLGEANDDGIQELVVGSSTGSSSGKIFCYSAPQVDVSGPTISCSRQPAEPGGDDVVTVTATIEDVSGVNQAILSYSIDSGSSWTNNSMVEESGTYTADIPAQDVGVIVQYKVLAEDMVGNWGTSDTHSYQVGDTELSDISLDLLYESGDIGQVKDTEIADIDHDGDPEILAGTCPGYGATGYVKVFDLQSETFETQFGVNVGYVRSISVSDLDDDGQLEVVAATCSTWEDGERGRLYIFDGSTGDIEWESADLDGLTTVEIVDIDGDESLEIVSIGSRSRDGSSSTEGHIYVYDASTRNLEWSSDGYGYFLGETGCVGNIDGDDALEIIFTGRSSASSSYDTTLYVVDGSSQATEDSLYLSAWRGKTTQITDLDSDGTPEVLLGTRNDGSSIAELRVYDHLLDLEWTHEVPEAELPSGIITGEFDGDYSLEIVFGVAGSSYGGRFYILDADTQSLIYNSSSTGLVESFSLGEANDDGLQELVVGCSTGSSSGKIFVYSAPQVDNSGPAITCSHQPNAPLGDDVVTVAASIEDVSGINQAILSYSTDSGSSWTNNSMVEESGTYTADIPAQDLGIIVQYKVHAEDMVGNWGTSDTHSYQVGDTEPPSLMSISQSPTSPSESESVTVTVMVSDPSSINKVLLSYSTDAGISWSNVTMEESGEYYIGDIPAQTGDTTVQYKIYAEDTAGNWVVSEVESYTVETIATTTSEESGALSAIMQVLSENSSALLFLFILFLIAYGGYRYNKKKSRARKWADKEKRMTLERRIQAVTKAYPRIELREMASQVNSDLDEVRSTLFDLIAEGEVRGHIDRGTDEFVSATVVYGKDGATDTVSITTCPYCNGPIDRVLAKGESTKCPSCGKLIVGK